MKWKKPVVPQWIVTLEFDTPVLSLAHNFSIWYACLAHYYVTSEFDGYGLPSILLLLWWCHNSVLLSCHWPIVMVTTEFEADVLLLTRAVVWKFVWTMFVLCIQLIPFTKLSPKNHPNSSCSIGLWRNLSEIMGYEIHCSFTLESWSELNDKSESIRWFTVSYQI